jgi:hypothetical protein
LLTTAARRGDHVLNIITRLFDVLLKRAFQRNTALPPTFIVTIG